MPVPPRPAVPHHHDGRRGCHGAGRGSESAPVPATLILYGMLHLLRTAGLRVSQVRPGPPGGSLRPAGATVTVTQCHCAAQWVRAQTAPGPIYLFLNLPVPGTPGPGAGASDSELAREPPTRSHCGSEPGPVCTPDSDSPGPGRSDESPAAGRRAANLESRTPGESNGVRLLRVGTIGPGVRRGPGRPPGGPAGGGQSPPVPSMVTVPASALIVAA